MKLEYTGGGIYSVPEASRLTGVSASSLRRWLRGYVRGAQDVPRRIDALWLRDIPDVEEKVALSFQDLIEVRFVDAFRKAGVSWKTLRVAHEKARKLTGSQHPFGTNKFRTEGRQIFADMPALKSEPGLVELRHSQHYFEGLLRPILKDLDFAEGAITMWWPMGRAHEVVLDPNRAFGQPIVRKEGVPTSRLALAMKAAKSTEEVCRWFRVSKESLEDAIAFEARKAA